MADIEYDNLRAIRRRAERRARKTFTIEDVRAVRRTQKLIQTDLEKLAKREWMSCCSKLDPRKPLTRIWSLVRGLRAPRAQLHAFTPISLSIKTTDLDVAEAFRAKITATQGSLPTSTVGTMSPPSANTSYLDTPFRVAELEATLASVQKASFPGPDGISYGVLSHVDANAKRWLHSVFNPSWETVHLKPEWKHASIVLILKPGKVPTHIDSYRPISLLSCIVN